MAGKKENPQSDAIADGSKGGEKGMKSLPGSISLLLEDRVCNKHKDSTRHRRPKEPPLLEEKMGGYGLGGGLVQRKMFLRRVTQRVNIGTKTFRMTCNSQDRHNI